MRKYYRLLVLIGLLFTVNISFSASVSENTARTVAVNFIKNANSRVNPSALSLIYIRENAFYVFSSASSFTIVAADDRITPILGYSTEGPFLMPTATDTTRGNNFWGLMNSFDEQIQYVVDNNIPATEAIVAQWSSLQQDYFVPNDRSMTTVVTPLLTTTWDQGWPYNSMCPVDASGPGGHVWAGCTATAMAQILKYHNYPSQGLGSYGYQWGSYPTTSADFGATTYNWTSMPNSISSVNTEISTLIYQTAVSCRSMWGAGSTGVGYTYQDPMSHAFVNYFKCAFSTIQYVSKGNYTGSEWDNLIQDELINNRPVFYRGDGIGSHAFVCDGVDASNLYHFNFGWGGAYNGYFALSAITPGGNDFTNNQAAIIGIKPNDGSTLVVNTTWSGTVTKSTHVAVPDAVTLTVNSGTMAKFAQACKLQVWGKILSTGTSSSYATFTAVDTTAGWWGIKFDNDYMNYEVMSDNDTSRFVYSQIQYSDMRGVTIKYFSKVVLDHCKINNNFIDGDEYGYNTGNGAGVFANYSAVQIHYSEFYNNHATIYGGGFFVGGNDNSLATISENDIYQNISDGVGGGFYLCHAVMFSDNLVHHNQAVNGAGAYLAGGVGLGEMSLVNNKFTNNATISSTGKGGGLYLDACDAKIVNNLIANNNSMGGAALSITNGSNPLVVNTTISKNFSQNTSTISLGFASDPTFKNTVFYGNYNGNGKEFYLGNTECDPIFDHCDLEGGIDALGGPGSGTNYDPINYTNNIDADPLFVSPSAGAGTGYNGLTADWSLQTSSLCINTGDTTGVSIYLPALDLAGNPRLNGIIDMGAYEYGCTPVPVSISIVADQNPVCAETTVAYTATPVNGGTAPVYQWRKNGGNVGSNSNTYAYIPENGDVITCILTSNQTCVTGNPATSNAITMMVTTPLPVSINIVADQNSVCAGTTVTYSATPTNGGTIPVYQWKKNGSTVGSNSNTYAYIPVNGDVITCILTSNQTCVTGNPATSNAIAMTLIALPLANAGSDQSINYGTSAILNGSATSGSGSYTWHWEPANLLVNPDIQNPTTLNLTSSVQFTLTVTDAVSGCSGSDVVLVTVIGGPLSLDVTATPGTTCAGSLVQLMAIPGGGTGNYTYTWSSNPSGFNSSLQNPVVYPTISTTYTVVVNDGNTTLSDFVLVTVNPPPSDPDMPNGPDRVDLVYTNETSYNILPVAYASAYVWEIEPSTAGILLENGTLASVTWDPEYLGNAGIRVRAINDCGESEWSMAKITIVDNTVGIATVPDCKLLVYPNPVKGNNLTISFCHPLKLIEIVDMKGSVLYTATPLSDRFGLVHHFTPGVYFIRAVYDQGTVVEKILVY